MKQAQIYEISLDKHQFDASARALIFTIAENLYGSIPP